MITSEAVRKVFYRPREVFSELKTHPIWLGAAVLLLVLIVAKSALVIDSTDRALEKLRTELFMQEQKGAVIDQEELVAPEGAVESRVSLEASEWNYTTTSVTFVAHGPSYPVFRELTALVFLFMGLVCEVAYFRIVSATMNLNLNMRHWVAFSIWSHVPAAVLALAGVVLVSFSIGNQIHPFDQANPINYEVFSLIRWIASPNTAQGGFNIFSVDIYHLDLALLWVIALQTIGFREWSGRSILTSFSIVAIPIALVYVIVMWMSADHLFWYVTLQS